MDNKIQQLSQELSEMNNQLYTNLLEQLNKDFLLTGIQWDDYLNILPQHLFTEVDKVIQSLLKDASQTVIYALLYRIDISEKVIHQTSFTNTSEITKLVMTREMEKIWMKHKYSNL